jgi:hypothetical protein
MRHGRRRHFGRHGHRGYGPGFGRRFGRFDRGGMLERLEQYQRDLEQELADVSDLIKRLQDESAQPGSSSEPATQV